MSKFREQPKLRRLQQDPIVQNPSIMKRVKNDTLQSHTLFFKTEKGPLEHWLQPGQSIVVPESYLSEQVKTLHRRRILKINPA